MPSNDVLRAPALLVLADGAAVAGVLSAHVTNTGNHGCDTFDVTIATSADPTRGPAFWAAASELLIDVQAGLGTGFTSLVQGYADSVVLDPVRGVVHLSGRDLSAAMIEAPTRETFANQTASAIATLLAGRHGLSAQVQQTTTPVGRYWQLEHDRITLNQFSRATTEWDLLVGLAEREGFDLWMTGSTLYFQPPSTIVAPTAVLRPVTTVNGPVNVESLRLERSLTLAGKLTVVVKSWNSRMAQGFTQQASTSASTGAARQYNFVLPNLTPDVALQIAQQRLDELSRHERIITAEMPGDLVLDAHLPVALEGTGTAFDQSYRIDELVRSIDAHRGFRQTVAGTQCIDCGRIIAMQRFLNAVKAHAEALDQGAGQARFGVVTSVDPSRPAARVALQPEGVITGWLPILSLWVGSGWGMACPPATGDQVLVVTQEGDADHGVIVGRAWSDQAQTAVAPVGEFWLVHQTGSFIKLQNDGTIQMQGDLHVNGDVYDKIGSLNRLRQHYDEHTHADPQGGSTSIPTPQD